MHCNIQIYIYICIGMCCISIYIFTNVYPSCVCVYVCYMFPTQIPNPALDPFDQEP